MFEQHNCPVCGSTNLVKNGSTYHGKARLKCKRCGRQFGQLRTDVPLCNECKRRIELLLVERISLEAICRVKKVKAHQLYTYINEIYDEVPQNLAYSVKNMTDIELVIVIQNWMYYGVLWAGKCLTLKLVVRFPTKIGNLFQCKTPGRSRRFF